MPFTPSWKQAHSHSTGLCSLLFTPTCKQSQSQVSDHPLGDAFHTHLQTSKHSHTVQVSDHSFGDTFHTQLETSSHIAQVSDHPLGDAFHTQVSDHPLGDAFHTHLQASTGTQYRGMWMSNTDTKLQVLVYNILPPTIAITGWAISLQKLSVSWCSNGSNLVTDTLNYNSFL